MKKKLLAALSSAVMILLNCIPVYAGYQENKCESNQVETTVFQTKDDVEQEALTYEEFADETGKLLDEYDENAAYIAKKPGTSSIFDYQTCRLLVCTNQAIVDETALEIVGPYRGIYILQYACEADARASQKALEQLEAVEFVQPDFVYQSPLQQQGPVFYWDDIMDQTVTERTYQLDAAADSLGLGSDWGAEVSSFPSMWDLLLDKYEQVENMPEILVADIDTGVYSDHETMQNRISGQAYDFVDKDTQPEDGHGHGTQVASIITQNTPANVKILPIKAFTDKASYTDLDLFLAVEYAIEKKADILNMSFGGYALDAVTAKYMKDAVASDMIIVAAYGNDGIETDEMYPACYKEVIGVSAVDSERNLASFSNFGSGVDLAAPGKGLHAANISGKSKYTSVQGTSFATPYVAAAAALLKTYDPTYTRSEISALLYNNSIDLGDKGWDAKYGYGLLSLKDIPLEQDIEMAAYHVTFRSDGGTEIAPQQVKSGEKISKPQDPVKEGYHFLGWYTDDQFFNEYEFDSVVNSNIILYAKWEAHVYHPAHIVQTVLPTYTSSGKNSYVCSVCGQIGKTTDVAMLTLLYPEITSIKNHDSGVRIQWKKVTGCTGYEIYRRTGSGTWKRLKTITSSNTLTYQDTTVTNAKKYTYRLKAINEVQKSSYSASKVIWYAAPTKITTFRKSLIGITVKWKKVTSASGYVVYRKTSGGTWKKLATVKGAKKISYTDKTAKRGKKYEYRIRVYKSVDGVKMYSAYSKSQSIKR